MNDAQKALLKRIEEEKRQPHPDRKALQRLVRMLTSYDDRTHDLKHGRRNDPGGRSRSPSFGQWDRESVG